MTNALHHSLAMMSGDPNLVKAKLASLSAMTNHGACISVIDVKATGTLLSESAQNTQNSHCSQNSESSPVPHPLDGKCSRESGSRVSDLGTWLSHLRAAKKEAEISLKCDEIEIDCVRRTLVKSEC
eukprot:CAMPEP_0196733196 /NCGR_PEP_ID=MMETSP1091-20130531/12362_1 /TAXON_ID=302021 /ORGANISM="Rhodomonas sp., Strain CCMP768" /LENGTH=125 /DNA_ID=CAMNT_0042076553 /DNA_START=71 /DNA_END=448 /DNA_ORIENTATION=+